MKKIPAHKFLLGINSPVFYAMFYSALTKKKDSIDISDCDYKSLLELFRFVNSDVVNLNLDSVTQVLYLAKKYMLPSLADKCTEYLEENLDASNVFHVLPGGRIQNMDRDPWTTPWTWSMDHPMDPVHGPSPWTIPWTTPNSQKEIAPVNMKIYRRSGYEEHILIIVIRYYLDCHKTSFKNFNMYRTLLPVYYHSLGRLNINYSDT